MRKLYDVIIIGGGAAGFFTSTQLPQHLTCAIFEKQSKPLQKVKVSGGGRCNVMHHCFDIEELIKSYPRGAAYLQGPFSRFGPSETKKWFNNKGVNLKVEPDGRMFPITDSSQTIIDCLRQNSSADLYLKEGVENFEKDNNMWRLTTSSKRVFKSKYLCITTGSDKKIWELLAQMGLKIIKPVPSLFTFKIEDKELHLLSGTSFEKIESKFQKSNSLGAGLITHWGLSGPSILKLSAHKARELAEKDYNFDFKVDWLPQLTKDHLLEALRQNQIVYPKRKIRSHTQFNLSNRFWSYVCNKANIGEYQNWSESGKKTWRKLVEILKNQSFQVKGKTTFKEEFVTAGGIDLEEIDLNSFSHKNIRDLYFAGEVLNIDAITGGFNFQAAWTAAWHVGNSLHNTSQKP